MTSSGQQHEPRQANGQEWQERDRWAVDAARELWANQQIWAILPGQVCHSFAILGILFGGWRLGWAMGIGALLVFGILHSAIPSTIRLSDLLINCAVWVCHPLVYFAGYAYLILHFYRSYRVYPFLGTGFVGAVINVAVLYCSLLGLSLVLSAVLPARRTDLNESERKRLSSVIGCMLVLAVAALALIVGPKIAEIIRRAGPTSAHTIIPLSSPPTPTATLRPPGSSVSPVKLSAFSDDTAALTIGFPSGWQFATGGDSFFAKQDTGEPLYSVRFFEDPSADLPQIVIAVRPISETLSKDSLDKAVDDVHAQLESGMSQWPMAESADVRITNFRVTQRWDSLVVDGRHARATGMSMTVGEAGEQFALIMNTATNKRFYFAIWVDRSEKEDETVAVFEAMVKSIRFID